MNTDVLTRGKIFPASVAVRVIPFAVFIGLLAAEPWLGQQLAGVADQRWLYGARTLVVAGLLFAFWCKFTELDAARRPSTREIGFALVVGLAVLAVWLLLDGGIFVLGQPGSGFDPRADDGKLEWSLVLMRLAGAALVVPVMEELFWRSLVMRWLEDSRFTAINPAMVGLRSLLLSSLAFGLEHSQWVAGIIAGLAYGWLYLRSGKLWVAVVAHAVTNAGLGLWVLATGAWYFW